MMLAPSFWFILHYTMDKDLLAVGVGMFIGSAVVPFQ